MRFLAIALVGAALAATGSSAAAPATAHGEPALAGMVESRGTADLGSAPGGGELLRFIPRSRFELGLLLVNNSGGTLEVTGARVLAQRQALIHQVGTHFHPWRVFKCPPGALSCPAHVFPLEGGAGTTQPYSLAARKEVGVELDFRLGSCAQIPGASSAPVSRLRVGFRRPNGTLGHRILSLGATTLHLRMPKPEDCAAPRSFLSVDGPQQYESGNDWTIPGSTGDVCAVRNGRLSFRSRKYQTSIGRRYSPRHFERVAVLVGDFHGTGTYDHGTTLKLVTGGKTVFRKHDSTVQVTKATAREVIATLDAGRLPSGTTRGIPFHVSGTMRCRVVR